MLMGHSWDERSSLLKVPSIKSKQRDNTENPHQNVNTKYNISFVESSKNFNRRDSDNSIKTLGTMNGAFATLSEKYCTGCG